MIRLIVLFVALCSALNLGAQRRFQYRPVAASGGSSGSSCVPTSGQLALRVSSTPTVPIALASLPNPGTTYCDPNFGTEILRMSDTRTYSGDSAYAPGSHDNDDTVSTGQVGFSKNNKHFLASVGGGTIRYDLALSGTTMAVTGPSQSIDEVRAPGVASVLYCPTDSSFWSYTEEDTLICVYGMRVFKVNAATRNGSNYYDAVMLADLTSELGGLSYYSGAAMTRCFASRDVTILGCQVLVSGVALPGNTCSSGGSPPLGLCSPRIGSLVFSINNFSPSTIVGNYTCLDCFVNAVHSANWYTWESVTLDNGGVSRVYDVYNGGAGGVKFAIDQTGDYVLHTARSTWDGGLETDNNNTQLVHRISTDTWAAVHRVGHSAIGSSSMFAIVQNGNNYPCDAGGTSWYWCLLKYNLATLSTTDAAPSVNIGTQLGPVFPFVKAQFYASWTSDGTRATWTIACNRANDATCDDPQAWIAEVVDSEFTPTGIPGPRRIRYAKTYDYFNSGAGSAVADGIKQMVQSRDGQFLAFVSNLSTGTSVWPGTTTRKMILIARVPQ